ncbi:hypothetical protein DRJ48_00460 [Candidatus Woesearchaeota archaeon]|nr:hypothetical protein [Candidatus Woesearchaeota archaeon]RLE43634.1 MAG: hypothetical protein DRJ48_00460 [Candidatus Woesearchaeota archaeon]
MNYRKIATMMLILLALPSVYGGVVVERGVPKNVYIGEPLTEVIRLSTDSPAEVELVERLPYGFELASPIEYLVYERVDEYNAEIVGYIKRSLTLEPGKQLMLEHTYKPVHLGTFYFPPIKLISEQGVFESEGSQVRVLCRSNGVCDTDWGENLATCPQDCAKGMADGYCDGLKDDVCDPDCIEGDPDCTQVCGDGSCDEAIENPYNCPSDCGQPLHSSYRVIKYYKMLLRVTREGVYLSNISLDFGAYYGQEPISNAWDFKLYDKSGHMINNFKKRLGAQGKITVKIPYSPIGYTIRVFRGAKLLLNVSVARFAKYCGDGVCSPDERYFTCPADCSSGMRDGYCDGLKDGVCDPDCNKEQDKDCTTTPIAWLLVACLLLVIAILALFYKLRKS